MRGGRCVGEGCGARVGGGGGLGVCGVSVGRMCDVYIIG